MAFDLFGFEETITIAEQVAPYIDILEIGTPCIKYNGLSLLSALKSKFPGKKILAELKTIDAGEYETTPFYAAGADICTVLGVSDLATIEGVIKSAKIYNAVTQVDLINVDNKTECAKVSAKLGAQIVGIHTGIDAQAAGETPFADLHKVASLKLNDTRISVAGGLKPEDIPQAIKAGTDIIVVGSAIYDTYNPAEVARKIRKLIDGA